MPLNLPAFKRTAAKKKRKLLFFLKKFDKWEVPDLPKLVKEAEQATWAKISCTSCANCCKTMTPTYKREDIRRISAHLGMKPKEFKEKWLYKEKKTGDWMNTSQPCQFLVKNMCSIYEVRPTDCAEFPHHSIKEFDRYTDTYALNMVNCPATFTLVENLQKKIEEKYEW